MDAIVSQLKQNVQLIYRKAIDADKALDALQKSGKGKFNHVFTQAQGFNVQSKRFVPYVEDLGLDIAKLEQSDEETFKKNVPAAVKKMELLLTTLSHFQQSLKDK